MALDGARALVFDTFGTAESRTPAAAEPGLGAERRRSDLTGRGARLVAEHAERAQGSVAKRSGTAQRGRRDLMAKYEKTGSRSQAWFARGPLSLEHRGWLRSRSVPTDHGHVKEKNLAEAKAREADLVRAYRSPAAKVAVE